MDDLHHDATKPDRPSDRDGDPRSTGTRVPGPSGRRRSRALARFYSELAGWEPRGEGDRVQLRGAGGGATIAFQRVADDYQPPDWPGQQQPQQIHLDPAGHPFCLVRQSDA